MATNYRKSFNFKNGVQVDTDNFVVDTIGRVGIGTSSPQEFLDIHGNDSGAVRVQGPVRITGLTTVTHLYAGIGTIANLTGTASSIGIGTFDQLQVGNSPTVNNLIGYAYTAWITDDGGVGLRTDSVVGIGTTTLSDFNLVIGSDPRVEGVDGIGFKDGDIRATGIITAPTFVGSLTGVAASATILEESRTFGITGDLEGAAISFDGSANVSIAGTLSTTFNANTSGIITAAALSGVLTASSGYIGTATVLDLTQVSGGIATFLNIDGTYADFEKIDIGIGTVKTLIADNSTATVTTLAVLNTNETSDKSEVSIGKSNTGGNQSVKIYYESGDGNLNVTNYDRGDINLNLHGGTTGVNTGGFKLKYKNDVIFHSDYEGNVSIKKDDADAGYTLDVDGIAQFTGVNVAGIVTVATGGNTFELDPADPPLLASSNINITNEEQNTLNRLQVGIISATQTDAALNIVFNESVGESVLKVNQSSMTFGFDDGKIDAPLVATFDNTNVSIGGTQGGKLTADVIQAVTGTSKIISPIDYTRTGNATAGNPVITGIVTTSLHVGAAITHGSNPTILAGGRIIQSLGANSITLDQDADANLTGEPFFITNIGVGETHFSGNIDNYLNRRTTSLGITTVFSDFTIQNSDDTTELENTLLNFDVIDPTLKSQATQFLYLNQNVAIGIGTTTLVPYHTPSYSIIVNGRNPLLKANTTTGIAGKVLIRRASDQFAIDNGGNTDLFNVEGRQDPRVSNTGSIDDWNTGLGVPYFHYGKNLDIDTTTSTMVFDGSLSIVPFPGKKVSGYGDPGGNNGSYAQGGVVADNTGRTNDPNTGETNGDRLTMVGINTYLPRSVVDFSGASATMNSYMLIPSLSQSDINTMATLWEQSSGTGVAKAKRVTPDGVPGGALLYNTTTNTIQVRDTANSFRTLGSPQVVQAHTSTSVIHGGSNTVTSEITTGLSTSITLRSSTSKVMVNVTQPFSCRENIGEIILKRTIGGVTQTLVTTNHGSWEPDSTNIYTSGTASISYLDTPGSTGPVTYETFGRRVAGSNVYSFTSNSGWVGSSAVARSSHITLMEIE